jgi:CRP-like cAMP-binding protein
MDVRAMAGPGPRADLAALAAALRAQADIPAAELAKLGALFRPAALHRGEHLLRAGETPRSLAFVHAGLLRLYYLDPEGRELTKSFCAEGEIVAAYSALLLGEPSRLFIEALEDCLLLVADYRGYQALAQGHPCWATVSQRRAEALFIKKEQREAALLLDDAATRYRQFLADHPGLERRLRQHHIASYLGITPVALSRIRARLRRVNPG